MRRWDSFHISHGTKHPLVAFVSSVDSSRLVSSRLDDSCESTNDLRNFQQGRTVEVAKETLSLLRLLSAIVSRGQPCYVVPSANYRPCLLASFRWLMTVGSVYCSSVKWKYTIEWNRYFRKLKVRRIICICIKELSCYILLFITVVTMCIHIYCTRLQYDKCNV